MEGKNIHNTERIFFLALSVIENYKKIDITDNIIKEYIDYLKLLPYCKYFNISNFPIIYGEKSPILYIKDLLSEEIKEFKAVNDYKTIIEPIIENYKNKIKIFDEITPELFKYMFLCVFDMINSNAKKNNNPENRSPTKYHEIFRLIENINTNYIDKKHKFIIFIFIFLLIEKQTTYFKKCVDEYYNTEWDNFDIYSIYSYYIFETFSVYIINEFYNLCFAINENKKDTQIVKNFILLLFMDTEDMKKMNKKEEENYQKFYTNFKEDLDKYETTNETTNEKLHKEYTKLIQLFRILFNKVEDNLLNDYRKIYFIRYIILFDDEKIINEIYKLIEFVITNKEKIVNSIIILYYRYHNDINVNIYDIFLDYNKLMKNLWNIYNLNYRFKINTIFIAT